MGQLRINLCNLQSQLAVLSLMLALPQQAIAEQFDYVPRIHKEDRVCAEGTTEEVDNPIFDSITRCESVFTIYEDEYEDFDQFTFHFWCRPDQYIVSGRISEIPSREEVVAGNIGIGIKEKSGWAVYLNSSPLNQIADDFSFTIEIACTDRSY